MAEEESQDFSKLDTEELVKHKNWKARTLGYEKLSIAIAQADPEDAVFKHYASSVKNFTQDSHAAAQEKGLDAALAFIDNAPASLVAKICGEVVAGIILKCFTARQKVRDKGIEIIMLFLELEKHEVTLEELTKVLSTGNKSPKIVSGCMAVMKDALRLFGPKLVAIKPILKVVIPYVEDRDKSVREEARYLLAEVHRWAGDAIKPQLQTLKPAQMTELEAEFEKHKGTKAAPEKLPRSEQAKKAQQGPADENRGIAEDAEVPTEDTMEVNQLDLFDPVEFLKSLPDDLHEKVQSKKWQERKEALENLDKLSDHPKLMEGDYGEIVSELKKMIAKDSNVIVVALAGKCLTNLAKGLPQKFGQYASSCVPVILEKFKEKKTNVVTTMRDAIDACFLSLSLDQIAESVVEGLANKSPTIKSETALFLTRCFCKFNPEDLPKKQLKFFAEALIKNSNDPDQTVRDAAFEALGTAMKVVGEKVMTPFLVEGVDELKLKKIQEYCEKAVIVAPRRKKAAAEGGVKAGSSKPDVKPGGKKPVVRPGTSKSAVPTKKPLSDPDLSDVISREAGGDAGSNAPSPAIAASSKVKPGVAKKVPVAAKPKPAAKEEDLGAVIMVNPKGKQQRINDEKLLKVLKWIMPAKEAKLPKELIDQLRDQATLCFSPHMAVWMFSDDFKNHLRAVEALQNDLTVNKDATISVLDVILKWLTIRFFDTNTTVMLKTMDYLFDLFRMLANDEKRLTDQESSSFIPFLLAKTGEKNDSIREKVRAVVRQLCCLVSYSKVYEYLANGFDLKNTKNARQRSECLDLATTLVEAYGMDVLLPNKQAALRLVAECIADKDAAVRNAALNNLLCVWQLIGDKIFKDIGAMSEKYRSMLDERIKRAPKKAPPAPKPDPEVRADVRLAKASVSVEVTEASPPPAAPAAEPVNIAPEETVVSAQVVSSAIPAGPARSGRTEARPSVPSPDKSDVGRPSTVTLRPAPKLLPISDHELSLAFSGIGIPKRSASMIAAKQVSGGSMTEVFTALLGSNPSDCLTALATIDGMISKEANASVISDNMLNLYHNLNILLRKIHTSSMSNYATNYDYISKCYNLILKILKQIFENQKWADHADVTILTELLYQLISVLLDKRMEAMNGGQEIMKHVNVITLRIVDNANRTQIICASVRLLRDLLGSGVLTDKFLELVIKAVWRCVRRMPDTVLQLHIDPIFLEIHLFLKQFPATHWRNTPDDTPFRTVKTILYTLTKMFGSNVLNHLSLVEDPQSSELLSFLKKVLQAVEREGADGDHDRASGAAGTAAVNGNLKHEETLSKIVQKVGSSDDKTVQQGLKELYEYKETHGVNLDAFLERTSPEFQQFIHQGLRMIEFEQKALGLPYAGLSEKGQGVINRLRGVMSSPFITAFDIENIKQMAEENKKQIRERCFETVTQRVETAIREADVRMLSAENRSPPKPPNILSPSRALRPSDENSPAGRTGNNLDAVKARVKAYLANRGN